MDNAKIAMMAGALADENRVKILRMLSTKELCACNILIYLGISQPTLSYHMRILTESGFVEASRRGKWTYYSLNASTLDMLATSVSEIAKTVISDLPDADCEE